MDLARNVIIVGGGPAGCTAAIYTARANLEPLVIEGSQYGGALMQTTQVENFPGCTDGVQGPALMDALRKQGARFGAELLSTDVTALDLNADPKRVVADDRAYRAVTLILAMGSACRRLQVPGEQRLAGHGVSWCATCDGYFFRGEHIAVVGGGDTALEEADFLTRFAESVTVVHRRDTLRASHIMQQRAKANPKIQFCWNNIVEDILGDGRVTGLLLRNAVSEETSVLPVAGVFVAIGQEPRSKLVRGQIDLDGHGYVVTEGRSTRTSLPGVFACGDLVDHVYRQAVTAAGSGCMAGIDAERYLVL